jgi:hypothetical protein
MCIYCGTSNYRKIYINHFGPIPKDDQGRSFDIHHIDGNRNNNSPENLKCVSLKDHYKIHESQGDWGACYLIAKRLRLDPDTERELAKKHALARSANGTHNFQLMTLDERRRIVQRQMEAGCHPFVGDKNPVYQQLKHGTHPFLGGSVQRKLAQRRLAEGTHPGQGGKHQRRAVENGTHNFLGPEHNRRRVENGTHNFLGGQIQSTVQQRRLADGSHNFVGPDSPSQIVYTCPHCGKIGKGGGMHRYHFDRCKLK